MDMLDFQVRFGSEEQCRSYLFERRWPKGFVCPKCGHTEYFNVASRRMYQCKACNHQTSLTARTIMDKSKTPLTKWFLAIYLVSEAKQGISTLRLSRLIEVAYYTAWSIRQKIRHAMETRDNNCNMNMDDVFELTESFFASPYRKR
jgi:ribosomal protein L37AE/L43A